MKEFELQQVINTILFEEFPNLGTPQLFDIDPYVKNGIEDYLKDLKQDDIQRLTRIRTALAMVEKFKVPEERQDDDIKDYFCVVCEKKTNNHGECYSNRGKMRMGYGSKFDTDLVTFTLCDDCLKLKKDRKIVDVEEVN